MGQAGYNTSANTNASVFVGDQAGYSGSSGGQSVAIGYRAEYSGVALGDTVVGYEAGYSGSGGGLTAIGYNAARYTNGRGQDNVAMGYNALAASTTTGFTSGGDNYHTAIGALALQNLNGAPVADTALGYDAGGSITSGSYNVAIGYEVGSTTLTTGSHNILIGTTSAVDTLSATTSNFVSVGNLYEGDASIDHIVFHGSTPTLGTGSSDCGTSPSIAGNDNIGIVTVGTSTNGGVCTVTFTNGGWATAPVCFAQDQTTGNLMRPVTATTTLKITGTLTAGDVISYACTGYQL